MSGPPDTIEKNIKMAQAQKKLMKKVGHGKSPSVAANTGGLTKRVPALANFSKSKFKDLTSRMRGWGGKVSLAPGTDSKEKRTTQTFQSGPTNYRTSTEDDNVYRVLRESVEKNTVDRNRPKLGDRIANMDGEVIDDDDTDDTDESLDEKFPILSELISHVKFHKQIVINRHMKQLWDHNGPRKDQIHTYVNYRYRIHKNFPPWFLPFCVGFTKWWDWAVFTMTVVTFYIVTYVSIFSFFQVKVFRFVYATDLIFLVDTLFRVTLEVWRYKNRVTYMILLSPYGFYTWLADALSVVPFDRLAMMLMGTNSLWVLDTYDMWRYNRFLRFFRLFTFLNDAERDRRISERLHFFIKYSLLYVMFIQLVACIYFYLIGLTPIDIMLRKQPETDGTWLANFYSKKPGFGHNDFDYYVLSIYFATSVVTTTGYGDMDANNLTERVISIVVMLIGAIVLRGLFCSRLTNLELKLDGARSDLFHRLGAMQEYLGELRAAQLFRDKVQEYYPLLWNFRSGVQQVPFFSILPRSMQQDIKLDFSEAMFHKSPIFRGLDEAFCRAVASRVQVILYNPGMVLCNEGQFGMIMYYVLQGELRTTCTRRVALNTPFNEVILRPGTLFGEMNLFFSYPHSKSIETRTCCQIIQIDKDEILEILLRFPDVLDIFRRRVQIKLKELHKYHQSIGRPPAVWIYASEDLGFYRDGGKKIPRNNFPVVFRRFKGLNKKIYKDFIDDSKQSFIVDMPCIDDLFSRHYTVAFENCTIPNILIEKPGVKRWTFAMTLLSLYFAFTEPYCYAFRVDEGLFSLCCETAWDTRITLLLTTLFLTDAWLEVTQCVPCSGLYYQIVDGFRVQKKNFFFWSDLVGVAALFISNCFLTENVYIQMTAVVGITLRIWRVNRYLTYLDNTNAKNIFFHRLIKTVLMLVYGVHFLACISFLHACPTATRQHPPVCKDLTWLNSYELTTTGFNMEVHHSYLADSRPYLMSFFYACATVSTAGFGDFNPQSQFEMFLIIFFELLSFYILCYSAAILTSALSCVVRPRLLLENKLESVGTFMDQYGIPESLRRRTIEHYTLQCRLWRGVTLPPKTFHYMFDSPNYLQNDALLMEFTHHLDGVSLFSKLDTHALIKIAKTVRRYLIPPGIVFLRKGEVRRKMYVVAKGSVGLFSNPFDTTPHLILEPTCHFGVRDLIVAEPSHYVVKTLSYTIILEIEYSEVLFLMSVDPHLEHLLFATKRAVKEHIDNLATEFDLEKIELREMVPACPAWISMPTKTRDIPELTYNDYLEPFQEIKFGILLRLCLLKRVINPSGNFALWWTGFSSMITILTIGGLLTESLMQVRSVEFRIYHYVLDGINMFDVFLRLHWGYYTKEGLLVVHPLQTALYYVLDGTFLYDVAFCFPYELSLFAIGVTNFWGTTGAVHWYSKLRWVRCGQIIRFPPILSICHGIFKARSSVLLVMYASFTLALCTGLAALATYIACPVGLSRWKDGDERKFIFCDTDAWTAKKDMIGIEGFRNKWVVGVYYVSQVILLIGYGDMITLKSDELLLLIIMMLFGCVIMVCALSDITAAEVELENIRTYYLENLKRMKLIMYRERVHPRLQKNVMEHLLLTWDKTKGLQAKELFADLQPALRADMFDYFAGLILKRIPLFQGLHENVLRRFAQCLQKIYFVKGDRMARIRNLETQMYIIVDGKVWITDNRRRWNYTLKCGESFGEVCMIYGTQRNFNAFAGSAVEVYAITREDYIHILLRYPTIGAELKRRLKDNNFDDLYTIRRRRVREERYENEELAVKTEQINGVLQPRNQFDATFDQSTRKRWLRRRVVDYGTENSNLPLLYFLSVSSRGSKTKAGKSQTPGTQTSKPVATKFKLIIHPSCKFVTSYMELVIYICCLTACMGVLEACFGDVHSNGILQIPIIKYSSLLFEILMYIRILIGFLTSFELPDGTYCKRHKIIAKNYMRKLLGFPLDALSSIPVYLFVNPANWTRWLPLIRLFRLIPFYRFQFHKEDDIRRSTFRQKVTISVVSFLIVAHFLACIFYAISACLCEVEQFKLLPDCSSVHKMCPVGTWTHGFIMDNGIDDNNRGEVTQVWRWYIRSLYWVVTTISTTGFGSITPHTIPEILLGIGCIYCGSFLLSVILSHFTSGISSITQSYREYFFQVGILNSYYKTIGISMNKERRVMTYFVYYWERMRGVPYHLTTSILPITLKIDLCYSLYGPVLEDCTLFEPCISDVGFMRQLCVIVQHEYYAPGTNIATVGDAAIYLYIVYRGHILSWTVEIERFKVVGAFNVSESFGKHGVLIYDQFYTKNYRAETDVEVLTVKQEDLLTLCRDFPKFAESLEEYTITNIDLTDGKESIFDYQRGVESANLRNKFSQQYIEAQDDEMIENEMELTRTSNPSTESDSSSET